MKQHGGHQAGFVDLHSGMAVIFILAVIGGCFWYVYQHQTAEKSITLTPVTTKTHITADDVNQPQKYHDSDGQFTVAYPGGWQINTLKTGEDKDLISNTTLTSPTKNVVLTLRYQKDFIPTDCIPDYYDEPFLSTNRCFSSEYLKADPLPTTAYLQGRNGLEKSQWYLTHYHFKTITINAKELYASCLVIGQPAVGKPEMGFALDHPVSHVLGSDGSDQGYLAACVDAGTQAADLEKPEAVDGETILRSLRFGSN